MQNMASRKWKTIFFCQFVEEFFSGMVTSVDFARQGGENTSLIL